ncbi:MAG: MarR family transcriptional regulator [Pseudonocardiaceae bacterium]|nr:MarR family transcriptional regulator [Pseudonocardiaceae bacterium]
MLQVQEARLVDLVSHAERRLARRIERVLESRELSLDQWRVLCCLAEGEGHPMSEIADYAMVPAPTLTKIVDRLIDRSLVYRRVDDADRRRILVFLAARGRQVHRRLSAEVVREEQAIVEQIGTDDTEGFLALLDRIVGRLG